MAANIVNATDQTFEQEVLKSDIPVLVDFWAPWCAPCKAIAPTLEEISSDYNGKVKVVKIDIDENPETPSKYSIRSIPTLMLFKDGQLQATDFGAKSKSHLSAFIDSNI